MCSSQNVVPSNVNQPNDVNQPIKTTTPSLTTSPPLICLEQLNHVQPINAIVLGHRATGKSTLIKELVKCHLKKHDARALVFHGSEKLTPVYTKNITLSPQIVIHHDYQPHLLLDFLSQNENLPKESLMVVFDTCFEMGTSKCTRITELLDSGVNCIFAADYPLHIPRANRSKFNHIFVFQGNSYNYDKRLFTLWNFPSIFHSEHIFRSMCNAANKHSYGYLLVDLKEKTCYFGRSLVITRSENPIEFKTEEDLNC